MIRMIRDEYGIDPHVVCDYCGEMIQDEGDGTIQWEVDARGIIATGRPIMLHAACGRLFALEHASHQTWQAEPLSVFAERLTATLQRHSSSASIPTGPLSAGSITAVR